MDKKIENLKSIFNQFNGQNTEVLSQLYEDNIAFEDPVTNIQGLGNLIKYYAHAYKNVKSIHFQFENFLSDHDQAFASWVMTATVKGLNSERPFRVQGVSQFKFSENGKLIYHRDYFDLGQMIYENLWGLGTVIKKIKNLLKVDL